MEQSEYWIMKLKATETETIKTLEVNEIKYQEQMKQRKELENEMIRANMIKEMEYQEIIRQLNELEKLILYGN